MCFFISNGRILYKFPISIDLAVYCNVSVLHNTYIKTDLELNGMSIFAILRSVYAIQYSVSEGT